MVLNLSKEETIAINLIFMLANGYYIDFFGIYYCMMLQITCWCIFNVLI